MTDIQSMKRMKNLFYILSTIISFCISFSLAAKGYSFHELDDFSYQNYGKIQTKTNRKNSLKDISRSYWKDTLYNSVYSYTRFYSQKGGNKEKDATEKYASNSAIKTETSLNIETKDRSIFFLFAPSYQYMESFHREKEILKLETLESLLSLEQKTSLFTTELEFGRGFQRLDTYGLFFSGTMNYAEATIDIQNQYHIRILGGTYNTNLEKKIYNQDNMLSGISNRFTEFLFFSTISLSYYKTIEKKIVSEGYFLGKEAKSFKPYGSFSYHCIELETNPIYSFQIEQGLFYVTGFRDKSEYSFHPYLNQISTRSFLMYTILKHTEYQFIQIGILKTGKDRKNLQNTEDNGYSGLLTDPRIFGGRSSFFLMHNTDRVDTKVFADINQKHTVAYNTHSMEMINLGMRLPMKQANLLFHWNIGYSGIGKGGEFITGLLYDFGGNISIYRSGYIFFSIAKAMIRPFEETSFFSSEVKLTPKYSEFTRIYFSAGWVF
jgi:hypothetical protein